MKSVHLSQLINRIDAMAYNRLANYIVPGVDSWLLGEAPTGGAKVRVFTATRQAEDWVTPHSHRFGFTALVLNGHVTNMLFERNDRDGELWCTSSIDQVCGPDGIRQYKHVRDTAPTSYVRRDTVYGPGEVYSMRSNEIHSIRFARDTMVLMLEGPQETERSIMLEPWVNGQCVPTFRTEDWMFQRDHGEEAGR